MSLCTIMVEAVAPPDATVQPSSDERGYYSIAQAATLLGVSRVTVWRWIRAGRLPASRIGERTTRIAREDIERALTPSGLDRSQIHLVPPSQSHGAAARLNGEHVTQFYDEDAFLLNAASDFIGTALRSADAAVVIATEAHRRAIEARMRAEGLDLDVACREGRYAGLDAAETLARLMVDGMPDDERFTTVVGGILARAGEDGRRIHAFGEMVALLAADGNLDGAVCLEGLWNRLQQTRSFSLFCAYPMEVFSRQGHAGHFAAVCAEHSRVVPAESYAALRDPDERLREIARLQQRARALEAEIAERERAEAVLVRKQQELDDFLENGVVGLHRVGSDGTILWANRAELDLLGYTREEYIGRPVADFHADAETIRDILRRRAAREELHSYPARLRCKDGSLRHVLISSNALWEDGRFIYTRCFTRDITPRVRAEQGRELLVRAGEVLTSSLDWDVTLEHVVELAMPMLGDFGFFDVVEPDEQVRRIAHAHEDPHRQAILDTSCWSRSDHTDLNVCALTTGRTGVHPDITDAWLQSVAVGPEHLAVMRDLAFRSMVTVPLRIGERTLGALTLFYADSGRRHSEDDVALIEELARRAAMAVENARLYGEAQAAIRMRDEFLSIASHELRNPVAGMKGAAQLLHRVAQRGQLDGTQIERYVGMIESTASRLADLTEDLLDVSRLRRGALPLRPQETDIAALIGSALARLQAQGPSQRILAELGGAPCPLVVDPDRIEQIVDNLVSNAVKYSPDGGDIHVMLASEGGGVLLSVRDSGIGLPPGASERIFEPFGRAPNAVERNIQGLGLGLYICRQIAEQHGGRLWAESTGEGEGATLRLWLPAAS